MKGINMNKLLVSCVSMLTLCSFCLAEDDDFEFWSQTTFNFKINEVWKIGIREDFRFLGGSFSEYQNWVFFDRKDIAENLDLGIGYRLIHEQDSSGKLRREHRPYVDLTFKTILLGFKCSDRNRFEYRDFENRDDVFRYRNQLKFSSTKNLFDLPLKPYIADEIFIQEEKGLYRNWIRTGILWDVNDKLDVNFFTIFQTEKQTGGWDDHLIGGIEMSFSF